MRIRSKQALVISTASTPNAPRAFATGALFAALLTTVLSVACESTVPINDNGCESRQDCADGERCERGACTDEPVTPLPTPDVVEPDQAPFVEPDGQPEPAEPAPTPEPTPSPEPPPGPCTIENESLVCQASEYCFNGDCFALPLCPNGACPAGLSCHVDTGRCSRQPCVGSQCGSCTVASCSDGLFCNGSETCDGTNCGAGTAPCAGGPCDETIDRCVECVGPSDCPAANESCVNNSCVCTPNCAGRQCGPDGCGGTCGSCGGNASCNASGACIQDGDICDMLVDNQALNGFADLGGSLNDPQDAIFQWGTGAVANGPRLLDDFSIAPRAGEEWTIDLTAAHDSYLYVYDISGGNCTEVVRNDDVVPGDPNSRVVFTPGSGTYRVVATTYDFNQQGAYSISARETLCGKPVADLNAYTTCKAAVQNYAGGQDPCSINLCVDFGNSREFCCLSTTNTYCNDTFGNNVALAGSDFAGSCGTPP